MHSYDIFLGNLPGLLTQKCFLIAIWFASPPGPSTAPSTSKAWKVRGISLTVNQLWR